MRVRRRRRRRECERGERNESTSFYAQSPSLLSPFVPRSLLCSRRRESRRQLPHSLHSTRSVSARSSVRDRSASLLFFLLLSFVNLLHSSIRSSRTLASSDIQAPQVPRATTQTDDTCNTIAADLSPAKTSEMEANVSAVSPTTPLEGEVSCRSSARCLESPDAGMSERCSPTRQPLLTKPSVSASSFTPILLSVPSDYHGLAPRRHSWICGSA